MSMTSPRTTLELGQLAPLPHRSLAAPLSTLPQQAAQCFFGAICGSGPITSLEPQSMEVMDAGSSPA
jgi:hypothetical protein